MVGAAGAALTEQEPAICACFACLPAWSLGGRLSGWRIGGKWGIWKPATSWTAVVSVGHITERLPCASWSTGRIRSESQGYCRLPCNRFRCSLRLLWHVPAGGDRSTSVTLDLVDQYCFRSNLFEWCLRSADSARKSKTCSHLYTNVHSSTSHKSQKVEKLQVSTGKSVDSVVRVTRWDRSQGLMLQLGRALSCPERGGETQTEIPN